MMKQAISAATSGVLGLIVLLAGSAGCSMSTKPAAMVARKPAVQEQGYAGEAVTAGEYYDAALAIEAAAFDGAEALRPHFDMFVLCQSSVSDIEKPKRFAASMDAAFRKLDEQNLIGTQIAREMELGGSFRLVHVFRVGQEHSAVFRFINSQGMNYQILKFNKNSEGKIIVDDIYNMMAGEMMSSSMRRMFLPFIAERNRSALQRMMKSENELVVHADAVHKMKQATDQKDFATALQICDTLPQSVRDLKTVLIIRLVACAQLEKYDEYERSFADFQRIYPGDRALDLLSLDLLLSKKKFDKAQAAINRIDRFVGGDHHLDVIRGTLHSQAGNNEEAEKFFTKAMANDDALPDAYWHMISLSLQTKQFDKTLTYLLEAETRFQLEMADLATEPDYAEFVKSAQYQEWLKRPPPKVAEENR